uniref:Uncharacterized protein n=1 Tax=Anguilla anguilla TaxID=7936 RepID=A0A0E9S5Z3_ANGAN
MNKIVNLAKQKPVRLPASTDKVKQLCKFSYLIERPG